MKKLLVFLFFAIIILSNCNSKKESTNIFEGYYSYLADANMFVSCDGKMKVPVEMKGEYLTLERKYLRLSDGNGEKVYVRLKGEIKKVPAMEGDREEDALAISEVLEVDGNKKCTN